MEEPGVNERYGCQLMGIVDANFKRLKPGGAKMVVDAHMRTLQYSPMSEARGMVGGETKSFGALPRRTCASRSDDCDEQ